MGDPFYRIGQAVGEIVQRINAPRVAGSVMTGVPNAVEHRIPHQHVLRRHVDLGPKHVLPILELSGPHSPEEI